MCPELSSKGESEWKYARICCLHFVVFLIYAVVAGILIVTLGVLVGQKSNKVPSYSSYEWPTTNDTAHSNATDVLEPRYSDLTTDDATRCEGDSVCTEPSATEKSTQTTVLEPRYSDLTTDDATRCEGDSVCTEPSATEKSTQTTVLEPRYTEVTTDDATSCEGDSVCTEPSVTEKSTQTTILESRNSEITTNEATTYEEDSVFTDPSLTEAPTQSNILDSRILENITNEATSCDENSVCMDSGVTEESIQTNICNDWEFRCSNGECINDWQKCNGKQDCQDGSDEVSSVCRNNTCKGYHFRCAYGGCTDKKNICDGIPDCPDSSDEQLPICGIADDGMFECKSGRQIEIWRACDGQSQCPDSSDEDQTLCGNSTCHSGQFRCGNGACLFVGSPCNGVADCFDNFDETPELCKDIRCNEDQFRCTYGVCIDNNYVCDGIKHCVDNSDEEGSACMNLPCNETEFQCSYGACIPMSSACDGSIDCVDGTDEVPATCQQSNCTKDQFRCEYGACISRTDLCDGQVNCADNSDEDAAQCLYVKDAIYTCDDGSWTQGFRVCDGVADCKDKSDENERICVQTVCHSAQTRCAYGACHMNGTYCDGVKDCLDDYDESYEVCAKIRCFLPPHPDHGRYTASTPDVLPGGSVETVAFSISCDEGYTVNTDEAVFCNNGRWSVDNFPKCVRYCTLPKDPSVAFKCVDPGTESDQSRPCRERELTGAVALPSCNGPNFYSTHALPHMTCEEGSWDKVANCTTECGRVTPVGKTTIAGGRDAEFGELPWHAAIYRKGKPYEQICGGSLVSENVVVSAAHCFWEYDIVENMNLKQPAENYAVAMGKLYRRWADRRDQEAQRSDVKEILLPAQYEGQAKNQQADIAVVIVSRPFEYRPHIRPVCLSFDTEFDEAQLRDGNKGKVAGWGRAGRNERESPKLKVVELPFIPAEECDARMPQEFKEYLTFDKFCAGFWQGGIAVCKGDSGGGLTFPETYNGIDRYFLRGVVSTAPKNDDLCNVDIYTTMTHLLQHQQFVTQNL